MKIEGFFRYKKRTGESRRKAIRDVSRTTGGPLICRIPSISLPIAKEKSKTKEHAFREIPKYKHGGHSPSTKQKESTKLYINGAVIA